MTTIIGADKEGRDIFVDVKYKCPICKELLDTYEEAELCRDECVRDFGKIEEVCIEPEGRDEDYYRDR